MVRLQCGSQVPGPLRVGLANVPAVLASHPMTFSGFTWARRHPSNASTAWTSLSDQPLTLDWFRLLVVSFREHFSPHVFSAFH